MPTITGTLLDGGGSPIASKSIAFARTGFPSSGASGLYSRALVTTTTGLAGRFSVVLTGGYWRMRWYQSELANDALLEIPENGGPYVVDDVIMSPGALPDAPAESPTQNFFRTTDALRISDTLEEMVAVLVAGGGEPVWFYRDSLGTAADDDGNTTIVRTDGVRYTRFLA